MDLSSSESGWADENIIVQCTLLPYVKNNHCMLIWDTFEAHKNDRIFELLKGYPNIHTSMIIGERTSVDQPLDISINKQFKSVCKNESIKSANTVLAYLEATNNLNDRSSREEGVVQGKIHYSLIFNLCS